MLGIAKKDSLFFLIALFIIYPSIILLWILFGRAFDIQFVVIAGLLLHFLIYGPMIINEQDEDKSNGYSFLATLPVQSYEIVIVKFANTFVSVLFFVMVNIIIFSIAPGSTNLPDITCNLLVTSGVLCLIFSALFYIGVFMFGYTKFFRFGVSLFGVVVLSAGVVAQFLFIRKINILSIFLERLLNFIDNVDTFILSLSGIVIYAGLMLTAIKIKSVAGIK
ncbi:ABC-2 transporter permease [candidate division KSB1 bacterium]|nr:ABC-2 transporter permease [candidate division KSB1 bacterium]